MDTLFQKTITNFSSLVDTYKNSSLENQEDVFYILLQSKLTQIKEQMKVLISHKKDINKTLSISFHKDWIQANLQSSLFRLVKAEKYYLRLKQTRTKKDTKKLEEFFKKELMFSLLSLQYAYSFFERQDIFKSIKEGKSREYVTDISKIEVGDVILSYKTSQYLRKDILANLVAFATRSHITHVSIVCDHDATGVRILTSKPELQGLAVTDLATVDGEIIIVLRFLKEMNIDGKFLESLLFWKQKALERKIGNKNTEYFFSEYKSWIACLLGVIYTRGISMVKKNIVIRNPYSMRKGIFCSELIDTIFKEGGTYLVPRSEHDSLVGPIEILYSPYFSFKGIMGSEKDFITLEKEIAVI